MISKRGASNERSWLARIAGGARIERPVETPLRS